MVITIHDEDKLKILTFINKSNRNHLEMKRVILNKKDGFTLTEAIGILAIIAILAGYLIPKIFEVIENVKINSVISAYNAVKAAVAMNIAKNGRLADQNGTPITYSTTVDAELVKQGLLDSRVANKIGVGNTNPQYTYVGIGIIYGNVTRWDLNGDGTVDLSDSSNRIVKFHISSLPRKLAWKLSQKIDGDGLSATDINSADTKGRVIYGASHGAGDTLTSVDIFVCNF